MPCSHRSVTMTKIVSRKPADGNANTPLHRHTKTDRLLEMLRTGTGASLDEMTEGTGWQPHTVRAAMTGLRKRGIVIQRGVQGTMTVWSAAKDRLETAQ
jgi:predicted ArsR family transcriptional regulator